MKYYLRIKAYTLSAVSRRSEDLENKRPSEFQLRTSDQGLITGEKSFKSESSRYLISPGNISGVRAEINNNLTGIKTEKL